MLRTFRHETLLANPNWLPGSCWTCFHAYCWLGKRACYATCYIIHESVSLFQTSTGWHVKFSIQLGDRSVRATRTGWKCGIKFGFHVVAYFGEIEFWNEPGVHVRKEKLIFSIWSRSQLWDQILLYQISFLARKKVNNTEW